jgi:hypothetical protein
MVNSSLKICNVYGPYANRIPYWDHLRALDFLNTRDIIMGGDFNFIVSLKEVWGQNPHQDPRP